MSSPAPTKPLSPQSPCPCGLPRKYVLCCGRYHAGEAAPTAEALMRSRYSAYVLDMPDYLRRSWHPDTCPADLAQPQSPKPRWLGLKVLGSGDLAAGMAWVEFEARYRVAGRAESLHERSRFTRVEGLWVYLDGEFPT